MVDRMVFSFELVGSGFRFNSETSDRGRGFLSLSRTLCLSGGRHSSSRIGSSNFSLLRDCFEVLFKVIMSAVWQFSPLKLIASGLYSFFSLLLLDVADSLLLCLLSRPSIVLAVLNAFSLDRLSKGFLLFVDILLEIDLCDPPCLEPSMDM